MPGGETARRACCPTESGARAGAWYDSLTLADRAPPGGTMPRILIVEGMQEISSFNPTTSGFEDFVIQRGQEVIDAQRGRTRRSRGRSRSSRRRPGSRSCRRTRRGRSAPGCSRVRASRALRPSCSTTSASARRGSTRVYFSLHGAMAADGELDPEGYLLEQCRAIFGADVPIVASLDMHGILTARMLRHLDGLDDLPHLPARRLRRHRAARGRAAAEGARGHPARDRAGRDADARARRRADHRDGDLRRPDRAGAGARAERRRTRRRAS